MLLLAVIFGFLLIGLVLVAAGTVRKNRWGINLDPTPCPSCNALIPQVRTPRSLKQALWGGSTCQRCGTESDKWGRRIPSS